MSAAYFSSIRPQVGLKLAHNYRRMDRTDPLNSLTLLEPGYCVQYMYNSLYKPQHDF